MDEAVLKGEMDAGDDPRNPILDPRIVEMQANDKTIRDKILHTLSIYPKISQSMLMIGIGTGIPSDMWHPVLDRLIEEGLVNKTQVQAKTPAGRDQVYTCLTLGGMSVISVTEPIKDAPQRA